MAQEHPRKLSLLWERNHGYKHSADPKEWFVGFLEVGGPKGASAGLGISLATVYRWIEHYGIEFEMKVK